MNELYHYGVVGMKWGVRRYQTPDGKRTLLGAERERAAAENKQAHKLAERHVNAFEKKVKSRSDKAAKKPNAYSIDRANRAKEELETAKKQAKRYTDSMDKKLSKKNAELDAIEKEAKRHYNVNPRDVKRNMDYMNDKELQTAINRINMQRQVNSLNPSLTKQLEDRVRRNKEILGLAVGAIATGTAFIKLFVAD